jgi:hypothetical protein
MSKIQALLLTLFLVAAVQQPAFAKGGRHSMTSTLMSRSESISGTVQSFDSASRAIVVKGSDGNLLTLKVGDRIKNFADIKSGEKVVARYFEPVAVSVEASSAAPASTEIGEIAVAPLGKNTKGTVADLVQCKGTIEKIIPQSRNVWLKEENGNVLMFKVAHSVKNFGSLNIGESVLVTHTTPVVYSLTMS